jgi:hypothetical protein
MTRLDIMIPVYHYACKPLFHAVYSNQKRHFSLVVSNIKDFKMTTHSATQAQNFPQSNSGFKFILAILAGVFLFYAVQSHLVTDAFIACLSLIFDKFSVKATGVFPDITLLILFALVAMGVHALIKNHFAVVITGAVLAVAVFAWGK